jgi:hypothetical protein
MQMNEFLSKYGRINTASAWIFPDDVKAGMHNHTFVIIGFDEIKSTTGKDIPVLKLQESESGTLHYLSLWATDQACLKMLNVEDAVTLQEVNNKVTLKNTQH